MTTSKQNQNDSAEGAEKKTSIYDLFGMDDNMEKKGIWIDYGPAGSFLIARAGGSNQKFANILQAKTRPYKFQIDNELIDQETGQRLMYEAFAEAVVLDWEGVCDRDGNPIPFSQKNCVKLFEDLPDLFHDLREQASKLANFRQQSLEEAAKNS
jgi:hypothetical protein